MNAAVSSPCLKLCRLDAGARVCTDCGRTLDEIARWGGLSEADRRAVMATLPARLKARQMAAQQQQ